ncbi:hypothetical protein HYALB_00001380 [Hymenoscyphus albidus]|uniref:Uncharacterized protein n=1 Tax=Hymenoscyphus albidus TaxID=595503 RepID=A0A9N9LES8_9HELO|nr:hypothetical protein HYALB_00001380 [Hymenoscyphus albidus]
MSRKLLGLMHENDLEGNHLAKEMAPSTLALLHRLKPAFAPIPTWFDREWSGERLEKLFNPGERKDSGGSGSPFGPATGGRFEGASWGTRGGIGTELYDAWLGRDANGWGGTKWEKENGRVCLPLLLLSPFEDKGRHRYSS